MRHATAERYATESLHSGRAARRRIRLPSAPTETRISRDRSGFAVFSQGDLGTMHVFAHEMSDAGDIETGHRVLGRWLATHSGSGSDWVHLQFHMAVFELARGEWHAAFERFVNQILPIAECTRLALTDAPSLLWRLRIAAPDDRNLPWQTLLPVAQRSVDAVADPFTVLHQIMVFAGAGDAAAITSWQTRRRQCFAPGCDALLLAASSAFASIARGEYGNAARKLHRLQPRLKRLGGSYAQNDLFSQLERWCTRHQRSATALPVRRAA